MTAASDPTLDLSDPYSQRLAALGVDATLLAPDSRGTLVDPTLRASAPGLARIDLPTVRTQDGDAPADVRLEGTLGEGGMGRVLSAQQVAMRREVAVKVLRADADPASSGELLREALVTGRLEHPNIVPIYLLGRTPEGVPLFVMKRIEGVPWSEVIADPSKAPGLTASARDDLELHLEVLLKVCDAMEFAHDRGILHRDLKPQNVMLGSYGEVYVVDWGIAVSMNDDGVIPAARDARGIAGTPAYMAPEMAAADPVQFSPRTDVYLLGAILHEIVSGAPPHEGRSVLKQLCQAFDSTAPTYSVEVPEELAGICRKAMARDPKDRFDSVDALRDAVLAFLRHRGSWKLCQEADKRAALFLAQLADVDAKPDRLERLHGLFSECRFGYQQALAEWEGNATARAGLDRLLQSMIEFELRRGNALSAESLIAEHSRPEPELASRVEQAVRKARKTQAKLQELLRLQRDVDFTVGSNARATASAALGVLWCVLSMVAAWLDKSGRWKFGYPQAVGAISTYAVMMAVFLLGMRRAIPLNRIQRKVLLTAALAAFGFVLHFVICWLVGISLDHALAMFLLWVGGGWCLMGILFDLKMLPTGITFALCGCSVLLWPRWQIEAFGIGVLLGYGLLALAWRERPVDGSRTGWGD